MSERRFDFGVFGTRVSFLTIDEKDAEKWPSRRQGHAHIHKKGTGEDNEGTKKGKMTVPNRMNFRKSSKGGGGHFQSKIHTDDYS